MDARNFDFGDDEPQTKPKVIKDLGWENGWGEYPQEYKAHVEGCHGQDRHKVETRSLGRCQTQYTCHTCGITWRVDSSD